MKTIEQMVQQEVSCCLSSLVSMLATADARPGTDLAELCDRALGLAMPVPDYEEAAIQAGWKGSNRTHHWTHADSQQIYDQAETLCKYEEIEPIDSVVYEHWAVSPWLAEKLVAQGEKVDTNFADLKVWARQSKDQQISADDVMVRIYARMMA